MPSSAVAHVVAVPVGVGMVGAVMENWTGVSMSYTNVAANAFRYDVNVS